MSERLQKLLARQGLGSRREIEGWIREGRLTINQQVAQLGDKVEEGDHVRLDGRLVKIKNLEAQKPRVLIYHKPEGEICTRRDPDLRPTVFSVLPKSEQKNWILVGRLDVSSSGLLLFTNHGELANRLMHPSYEIEREYAVRVLGEVTPLMLSNLKKGVLLDDGPAKFLSIEFVGGEGANRWYKVTLKEGRNREVRRLWESQGVRVSRLMRTRYGNIILSPRLKRGEITELKMHDIKKLMQLVDLLPSAEN